MLSSRILFTGIHLDKFLNKVKVSLFNHYFCTFVSDVKSVVSSHEQVQSSWEESVSKHLNSRKSLFITYKHQNVRFNPITTLKQRYNFNIILSSLIKWLFIRWNHRKFKTYSEEKFMLKSVNQDNSNLKSFYSISHTKKRRKMKTRRKCFQCGKWPVVDRSYCLNIEQLLISSL